MKYTHELGEAMVKYTNMADKMAAAGMIKPDMMTMHHQHIMINHALGMAAEGSSMVMLGQMGMAGNIDTFSVEHGRMMMNDARLLLSEAMEGKEMRDMHKRGVSPEKDPMMKETHALAETAMKIMDLLSKMPVMGVK